jgi:hypothetical protein
MNKSVGVQLLVFGLILAGFSYLAHTLSPNFTRPTLVVGLAGGVLCLLWGVLALKGRRGKALPIHFFICPMSFSTRWQCSRIH